MRLESRRLSKWPGADGLDRSADFLSSRIPARALYHTTEKLVKTHKIFFTKFHSKPWPDSFTLSSLSGIILTVPSCRARSSVDRAVDFESKGRGFKSLRARSLISLF